KPKLPGLENLKPETKQAVEADLKKMQALLEKWTPAPEREAPIISLSRPKRKAAPSESPAEAMGQQRQAAQLGKEKKSAMERPSSKPPPIPEDAIKAKRSGPPPVPADAEPKVSPSDRKPTDKSPSSGRLNASVLGAAVMLLSEVPVEAILISS